MTALIIVMFTSLYCQFTTYLIAKDSYLWQTAGSSIGFRRMTLAIITIITMKIRILFLLITILISCKTKEKYLQTKSKPVETSKTKSKPILSEDSLDIMIGQMILVGLNDRTVLPANDSLRKELRAGKIGSVIIFEKNISKTKSAETLKTYCRSSGGSSYSSFCHY